MTLVAFACDCDDIQPALPQVFVLNERVVGREDAAEAARRCSDHVLMVRRKSAWVNAEFAVQLVNLLAKCLKDKLRTFHVVLYMDTCPCHMHKSVLKACSEAGIYPVFVPASTTGWLQPLDVAVFAKFKGWVTREIERERLSSTSGQLSRPTILDIYRRAVDAVVRSQGWG